MGMIRLLQHDFPWLHKHVCQVAPLIVLMARSCEVFAQVMIVNLQAKVRVDAIDEFAHFFSCNDLRACSFGPTDDDVDSSFVLGCFDAGLVDGFCIQIGREQGFYRDAASLQNFNHLG